MANDRRRSKPSNKNGSRGEARSPNGRQDDSRRLVEPPTFSIDRRDFVKLAGIGVPFAGLLEGCALEPDTASAQSAIHIEGDVTFDFSLNAVRKEDFLLLRFEFLNFAPDQQHQRLVRLREGEPSLIVVNFQPQHVTEETFVEVEDPTDPADLPSDLSAAVQSRISGPSRVAFVVPSSTSEIPLSLSGLLELIRDLELHVAVNALPKGERVASMTIQSASLQKLPSLQSLPDRGRRSRSANWRFRQRMAFAERHWRQVQAPLAAPDDITEEAGLPTAPANHETALEIPYRLILSPDKFGAWAHATEPVESGSGRIELWHSRLGVRRDGGIDEQDPTQRTARAIWTRDEGFLDRDFAVLSDREEFNEQTGIFPHHALTGTDRGRIVNLTSNFDLYDGTPPPPDMPELDTRDLPSPVNINRLMLTSMGGWLDSVGEWPQSDVIMVAWEHRATFGRDQYVKVVERGVLYPFGHRANLIRVTERKLKALRHEHTALLRTRVFILVQEPQKDFVAGRSQLAMDPDPTDPLTWDVGNQLRRLPVQTLQVKTIASPSLDADNVEDAEVVRAIVPRVGGVPFRFRFEALDAEGNLVKFSAPVVWIPVANGGGSPPEDDALERGIRLYSDLGGLSPSRPGLTPEEKLDPLDGQRLAFAPANQADDTVFETDAFSFDAVVSNFVVTEGVLGPRSPELDVPREYPGFFPVIERLDFELQSVRQVSGKSTPAGTTKTYAYHGQFAAHGFPTDSSGGNQGELMLRLSPAAGEFVPFVSYSGNSDRSGGLVTPSMNIVGLSRRIGPVSGSTNVALPDEVVDAAVAAGQFDPQEFFSTLNVRLFGAIDLIDILDAAGISLDKAPKYITDVVTAVFGVLTDLERLFNDLSSLSGYNDAEGLLGDDGLIQDLFASVDQVTGGDPSAIDAIPDQVTAVVAALAEVPGHLQELFETLIPSVEPPDAMISSIMQSERDLFTARATALVDKLPTGLPDLITQLSNLALTAELPKEIRTQMQWRGKLAEFPAPSSGLSSLFRFFPNRPDGLLLSIEILAKSEGAPQITLACSLEDFNLELFDKALTLRFQRARFSVELGKKPDVAINFKDEGIIFGGVLAFIGTLQKLIPIDGFSDPPNLVVDETGVTAGFSIALPNIAVGVFSLENLSLAAELRIPFIGPPLSFRFDFCTRENPFVLTVALLGGGGFFGVTVSPDGLEMLEATLEATARLSVNFVVASGSVSASLGLYFKLEVNAGEKEVSLTAYFKLHGEVDVLGLISASITLTLSLTYNFDTGKLSGKATLEIEVEVLFFSASVTIECERTFAGSNGDPTFREIMAPDGNFRPWNTYLEAFAA